MSLALAVAASVAVGMLVALVLAFLTGDGTNTWADAVLPAGQLALASGDGITNVLTPSLWVGAAGDRRGGENGRRHQADRGSDHDSHNPDATAPWTTRNRGM
jgi:hypothetical protein